MSRVGNSTTVKVLGSEDLFGSFPVLFAWELEASAVTSGSVFFCSGYGTYGEGVRKLL